MKFLEKNLEDIIFESDRDLLKERGLDFKGQVKRQLKIGNYGFADLVTFSRRTHEEFVFKDLYAKGIPVGEFNSLPCLDITVYELKKELINVDTLLQAVRYCKGIKRYFEIRKFYQLTKFKIVLIGSKLDTSSDFIYLSDFLCDDFFTLETLIYKYEVDGIWFKKQNSYQLKNEGF